MRRREVKHLLRQFPVKGGSGHLRTDAAHDHKGAATCRQQLPELHSASSLGINAPKRPPQQARRRQLDPGVAVVENARAQQLPRALQVIGGERELLRGRV